MTQKSRRRKLEKKQGLKLYIFSTPTRDVQFKAENLTAAKERFQERFGYWPNTK